MMHGGDAIAGFLTVVFVIPDLIQVAAIARQCPCDNRFDGDNPTGWRHDCDDTKPAVAGDFFYLG